MALINTASPVGGWYAVKTSNPVASQYLLTPNASAITTADISWQDPMDDLVLMANELAFRTAFATTTQVVGKVSSRNLTAEKRPLLPSKDCFQQTPSRKPCKMPLQKSVRELMLAV